MGKGMGRFGDLLRFINTMYFFIKLNLASVARKGAKSPLPPTTPLIAECPSTLPNFFLKKLLGILGRVLQQFRAGLDLSMWYKDISAG